MRRVIEIKTIKMAVGAAIAILIAQQLELQYATSAGIITLLSIQNTRKESMEIALRRIIATVLALLVGTLIFKLMGHHPITFGLYLLCFIPMAVKGQITEGIVPASVLVTHLLGAKQVTFLLISNELGLMLVGVSVALFFNIYMPSLEHGLIEERKKINKWMYELFIEMEQVLTGHQEKIVRDGKIQELKQCLEEARQHAHQYSNNNFINEKSLYEKYFEMRYSQYQILCYLIKHFERIYSLPPQAETIARLVEETALTIKGEKTVEKAMKTLEELRDFFKTSPLPETRSEFENRAMLYQFLTDIEQFLCVKKLFKEQLTDKEIKEYRGYYN